MKKQKKYWYFITRMTCPVCGFEHVYRERQYTTKPKEYDKRVKEIDMSHQCWMVFEDI
jgi:hypothetical protein